MRGITNAPVTFSVNEKGGRANKREEAGEGLLRGNPIARKKRWPFTFLEKGKCSISTF